MPPLSRATTQGSRKVLRIPVVSAQGDETPVLPWAVPSDWAFPRIQELGELDASDTNPTLQAAQNNGQTPARVVNNLKSERRVQPPKTILSFVYHQQLILL